MLEESEHEQWQEVISYRQKLKKAARLTAECGQQSGLYFK